ICLFKRRGATFDPEMTLIRDSARCPCTVWPPKTPGPSKRTLLNDSVFETYSVPVAGFVAILNSVVPTWAKAAVWVRLLASKAKTSLSGRLKRTEPSQLRCSSSSQWPEVLLYLTISETSGAGSPAASVAGPGLPPGLVLPSGSLQGLFGWNPGQTRS